MPTTTITDIDDPRLEPYRSLKYRNRTRWSGQFIAEGHIVVLRLFQSHYEVESVLLSDKRVESVRPELPDEANVFVVPHEIAQELLGYKFHTGVVACGRRRPATALEDLLGSLSTGRRTFVICDQVTDQENLGAIVRHCAAFGVDGLLLGKGCADPFSRRVIRVSMGNAFFLPILESPDLAEDLRHLRGVGGFDLLATVLDETATPLTETGRGERLGLVLGSEAAGIRREIVDLCDRRVTIPMEGGTDSLNVATAVAIFLHYFQRVV